MMWKTTITTVALLLTVYSSESQSYTKCKTHDIMVERLKNQDYFELHQYLEKQTNQFYIENFKKSLEGVTIPVIFQILHFGNEIGEKDNLSTELIEAQLNQLNKDFRRKNDDANKTPEHFQSLAVDTEINFRLADLDTDGNATNGIVRTDLASLGLTDSDCLDPETIDEEIVKKTIWNSKKYLNIYSVPRIDDYDYDECLNGSQGGTLGYAQLPNTGDKGTDAIVNASFTFGSATIPNPRVNQFIGRTITHEVGHWMNLEHIWGDDEFDEMSICSGSDKVEDTPNQEVSSSGCPSGIVTDDCTSLGDGIMYQNYMDYTEDFCMNLFTKGQQTRMMAALLNSRSELLENQPFVMDTMDINNSSFGSQI